MGNFPASRSTNSTQMPASCGVHGPGEITIFLGLPLGDLFYGDFVVAVDFDLTTEFAQILSEVVGEGIVVVEQ